MTRKKVKLAWITNNTSRRASLKKRRLGLVKKVVELTTLCGIEACLLLYSPGEQDPMAWPSPDEVKRLIEKFHLIPELEPVKKTMNTEMHMKDKLSKVQDQLVKLNRKNKEAELGQFMLQIHQGKMIDEFNLNELDALIWFGEERMKNIRKRIEYYKQIPYSSIWPLEGDVLLLPPPPQGSAAIADYEIGGSSGGIRDNEREAVEYLSWNNGFHNIMNTNKFRGGGSSSSVQSNMGLTLYNPYIAPGSSGVAPQFKLSGPSYGGNSSVVAADLGQPGPSIDDNPSAIAGQVSSMHPFGSGPSSSVVGQVPPKHRFGSGSLRTAIELVIPRHPFCGGFSSATAEQVPLGHPFSRGSSSAAVEQVSPKQLFFGGSSSVAATDHGLPPFETFNSPMADTYLTEGGYFNLFGGHELGPGHYPLGPLGSGSPTIELNPFGYYGGESSSSSSSGAIANSGEMGPFDDRN